MSSPTEDALDEAWSLLDAGQPAEALGVLAHVDERNGERWVAEGLALLELGDAPRANGALLRAEKLLGADDASVRFARAEWHLAAWHVDEARAAYDQLELGPAVLERLALCADLAEEHERADEYLRRAHELDPEGPPPPPRLSPEEFEEVVAQAARTLPEPFAEVLERVPVLVVPMPTAAVVGRESHPETCGLFSGPSALELGSFEGCDEPARIYLFQRNVERLARTHEELVEEIHVTLYHELGHALGFDEEGVEELGLE